MSTRTLKLGQLEKLRKDAAALEAQAANHSAFIEMKNVTVRKDYAKLDAEAIYQAAYDLKNTVLLLRETKALADELYAELYD